MVSPGTVSFIGLSTMGFGAVESCEGTEAVCVFVESSDDFTSEVETIDVNESATVNGSVVVVVTVDLLTIGVFC